MLTTALAVTACSLPTVPNPAAPNKAPTAPSTAANQQPTHADYAPQEHVPAYQGDWAGDFDRTYRKAKTAKQRQILTDGKITEKEMRSLYDDLGTCLADSGFTEYSYELDGSLSYRPPKDTPDSTVDSVHVGCAKKHIGEVDLLFNKMRRNPDRHDEHKAMAECLVREGLAPKGYTKADYLRDSPNAYPFNSDDKRFSKCLKDPLKPKP